MIQNFILPDRLDSSAAPALARTLSDLRSQPVALDASGVEVIGALACEVIIAAQRQWKTDGQAFTVTQPSARFEAACAALGLQSDAPWQSVHISEDAA